MALVIKKVLGISSLNEIPEHTKIYNTDSSDLFSKILRSHPGFFCSAYFPDVKPGTKVGMQEYCQNLEQLSFEDNYFDIVISEDVFEHVRDYKRGLAEVWRVLKPNGYHVFTVPFRFNEKTLVRVDTSTVEDIFLLPPEYHGDSIREKILAYRTFGEDFFDDSNSIGFKTEVQLSQLEDRHFGIVDSYVFVSKKIPRP